jgi:putative alpha-1,2-mannosidase
MQSYRNPNAFLENVICVQHRSSSVNGLPAACIPFASVDLDPLSQACTLNTAYNMNKKYDLGFSIEKSPQSN